MDRKRKALEVFSLNILVIDGQGGGLGKQLVSAIREAFPKAEITAVGTNSVATGAMRRAGADQSATGENAVLVGCRRADIITGPVGIAITDSLCGEITPRMAAAVGQSLAKRVFIPVNMCDNIVVGVPKRSMAQMVMDVIEVIREYEE